MKIHATYKGMLYDEKGNSVVNLVIANYHHQMKLIQLDKEVNYSVEIKEVKSKRSLNQNRYFWRLMKELEIKSEQDHMIWYAHLLEENNCEFDYVMALEKTKPVLESTFRVVKEVDRRKIHNKEMIVYKCYLGTSKFKVSEMQKLIELLQKYCFEYGIDVKDYQEE